MSSPAPPARARISPVTGTLWPVLSVVAGIAAFSAMDAAIKGASLAVGVFTALLDATASARP